MKTKVKFNKVMGMIGLAVTGCALFVLGGREYQQARPTQTPGMIAVQAMSQEGLINDKVAWQRVVKETNHGRDLTTVTEISQALSQANSHSRAVNSPQAIEDINYPSTTKFANYTMVNVPSFWSVSEKERKTYIRLLQKKVQIAGQGSGPVVLNFANNSGGDVIPMIAGLSALLPNGDLWAQVDKHGHKSMVTLAEERIKQPLVTQAYHYAATPKLLHKKVWVIMNKRTYSAGEMAIIALKQNPNCQIIGTDSGGLTSANQIVGLAKDNWAAIITSASLYSPAAIHGQHHFNNVPLIPDTWTIQVPITNFTRYNQQQPLDRGFLQELQTAIAS
ncbi:S41 family peptidase [Lapidilactobacillus wuchangensis]|uniref:S41 family peptidase n=1 Tax=Lapidilactobacillus wuchangensis TaxID=2486001 RepID=UPI000F7A3732|nr:S41 family peptidase [Lapidilactobacillus wuchangensis]